MTTLERAILATICYYDALDYPLTAWEVGQFLINPHTLRRGEEGTSGSFRAVRRALHGEALREYVEQRNGFYMLTGREELAEERVQRQITAIPRWRRATRLAWLLQSVSFVRLVAGSGSLALSNMTEESDLDFFIVTAPNRIWTTRLLVAALLQVLGVRRHGTKIANRVCLNHFVTTAQMTIPHQTMYTAQLYARLVPLVDRGKDPTMLRRFWDTNRWLEEYLAVPPEDDGRDHRRRVTLSPALTAWARFWEWMLEGSFGDWVEQAAKQLQLWWMGKSPGTAMMTDDDDRNGRVVISDTELAFHPDSPEVDILARFNKQLDKHDLQISV